MLESHGAPTIVVGWAIVWFLGQGLLIGLAVATLLRALRGRSAEIRYGVACLGLLAMAACPIGTTLRLMAARRVQSVANIPPDRVPSQAVAIVNPTRGPATARLGIAGLRIGEASGVRAPAPIVVQDSPSRRDRIERVLPAVVAAWLVGVGMMALRLILGFVEVRDLKRRGISPLPAELRVVADRLVERSGLHGPVSWLLSQRVETPAVIGWLRPTVLVPLHRMAHLTGRQIEAVLAHELAHILRHDYLVNVCQVAVETVLFFHPAVWWVSKRIRVERENCCDDQAAALCGDRLLVARALFALEEGRASRVFQLAADGGSLKERVRRLALPDSSPRRPADAGWIGGSLIVGGFGVIAALWLAGPTQARDDKSSKTAAPTVRGRVLDETGRPIAGARVRLYYRDSRWERRHPVVEEVQAGPDGEFRLTTALNPRSLSETRGFPPYVIVADHPGKAVGWRIVPNDARIFEGDLTLTPPISRTITVVDADGNPVPGAKVVATGLGDPASASAAFRDNLEIRPDDGPLTAFTDEAGKAQFSRLPKTFVSIAARGPGLAETPAFGKLDTIRLTPSASLSGRLIGPAGEPLPGVKLVLHTDFMWDFEYATTDADGRYRFDDLPARGWDMSAWGARQKCDGSYKLWIDDERFVIRTQSVTLEPKTHPTQDLQAQKAGVIRVSVVEQETGKPIEGVRVWGFDAETGGSGRFSAYTDARGRATFRAAPSKINLSIAGPPEGVYIKDNGNFGLLPDSVANFEFQGGEKELTLKMPAITGLLVGVPGRCTLPDGAPVSNAAVSVSAGRFLTSGSLSYIHERRTDADGRFRLEGVPGGERIYVYAESADRRFAGAYDFNSLPKPDPRFRINVGLNPTVDVERIFKDRRGNPLASKKFSVVPKLGEEEFIRNVQTVESDATGQIRFHGIVPGLSYHIHEVQSPRPDAAAGPRVAVKEVLRGAPRLYDEVVVLAPEDQK
jgi:beta-lactamase regulating signal transducer with metallopeptidase domain